MIRLEYGIVKVDRGERLQIVTLNLFQGLKVVGWALPTAFPNTLSLRERVFG